MSGGPIPCPDRETLTALLQGRLVPEELDRIAPHVESCTVCGAALENMNRGTGHRAALDRARTAGPLERAVLPLLSGMLEPCGEPGALGRLGSWLIFEVIDRGGMGIVLRGQDPALQREVAVKVLGPELAGDAECRARFLREAQAAAAVDHENVMPVYAVCQDAALPYLVMPFNQGESLQQKLDREGRLPFAETVRIGRAVAAGLAAAHVRGLVHRDVKPGNILLGNDGRVRLADFGLAQAADSTRLTRSGILAGTPGYMAPEQLDGAAPDTRTDLFALGAVLYRMLTGHGPFDAPTAMAVMKRVVFDEPPAIKKRVRPAPPEWFVSLTEDLLRKKPEDRPPSAAAVVDRMDRRASPYQLRQRRRKAWTATAVAAVALSGWLAHRTWHQAAPKTEVPPSALELDLRLAAERAKTGNSAERIAWLAAALRKEPEHAGAARMLLHELAYAREPFSLAKGGPALPLTLTAGAPLLEMNFGSDGKDIYVETTDGMIHAWNARNGQSLLSGFTWPGDARVMASGGEFTAFVTPDQVIWVVNHRGFSLKTKIDNQLPLSKVQMADGAPVLLTGGTDGHVASWNLETATRQHSWPPHGAPVTHLLVTEDGTTGVSAASDGTVQILDLASGKPRGKAMKHEGPVTWASLSPDESLLATGSADGTARIWDVNTASPVTAPLRHGGACPPGDGIIGVFLDDRRLVTAGTDDGMARIWDTRTGEPAHESLTHSARVTALASQAGLFATGDASGTVRLWDAARAEPASPALAHPSEIRILRFSSPGTQLLAGGAGPTAWLYELAPPEFALPPWFPDIAEQLGARRINARGVAEILPTANDAALRAAWPNPVPAGQAFPRRVAEWLLAPAEGRAGQPFSVPQPLDSPGGNSIRELLFQMFREQVEKQMDDKPD